MLSNKTVLEHRHNGTKYFFTSHYDFFSILMSYFQNCPGIWTKYLVKLMQFTGEYRKKWPYSRWVLVVEFHDWALGIGKVFGQESTVVKWKHQILGLRQVTVCQKLGVILVIKWFKNWSQQKMLFTKKVCLNWYSSMKFF